MPLRLTTKEFIERAKTVHGNKYDYSKVNYINSYTKVCIVCNVHGEFWQKPNDHLNGHGCAKCGFYNNKLPLQNFIERAKLIHGDKYDYSKVEYINKNTKVCIICPEHGEFWQTPNNHLAGNGCQTCSNLKRTNNKTPLDNFIEKAKLVHGDKYDYSKVEYVNSKTRVCIICPEHGEFWITPDYHIQGGKCKQCKRKISIKRKKSTTEEFIAKAKIIHDDKYDYSKVNYINSQTKICIICPEHGEFWQVPNSHLSGNGCPKCSKNKKSNINDFILKAKQVHGDKYDYSKVNYINSSTKVCIICPEHGEFWQRPVSHIHGQGCPKCSDKHHYSTEEFIKKAIEIHGDKYDYSKLNYVNNSTKVCIICPEHGEFWQLPYHHLNGHGCKKCAGNEMHTTEQFIRDAKFVHGDKYDYSKTEYTGNKNKVCIICPEHDEFWQKPNCHLNGHGCPECAKKNRSRGETRIKEILDKFEVNYIHDKACLPFLKQKRPDFYLPDFNLVIEYDGKQHFTQPHGAWKSWYNNLDSIKFNDSEKVRLCIENGVKIERIPYTEYDNIEKIISDILKNQKI